MTVPVQEKGGKPRRPSCRIIDPVPSQKLVKPLGLILQGSHGKRPRYVAMSNELTFTESRPSMMQKSSCKMLPFSVLLHHSRWLSSASPGGNLVLYLASKLIGTCRK